LLFVHTIAPQFDGFTGVCLRHQVLQVIQVISNDWFRLLLLKHHRAGKQQ